MSDEANSVDYESLAYREMAARWRLIDALRGGTQAMRAAGSTWLPMEEAENPTAYEARLGRSVLLEAYNDTVQRLAGKPFVAPVTLAGELPEPLDAIGDSVDHQGTDLTQLARQAFESGIHRGLVHILVDYPRVGGEATLADERANGIRPRFVLVRASQVIGWRTTDSVSGAPRLSEVRIRERGVKPDGDYGETLVERVRVYQDSEWELWEKGEDDDEFHVEDQGAHTFEGVPLVTVYFNRTGFMTGRPCLEALAWKNLEHWQSSSDQRTILHYARIPLLWASGLTEEEREEFTIGPRKLLGATDPQADLKYVEPSGAAITAGRQDLLDLQAQMEVLGMQPLVEKSGGVTATARAIDEGQTTADIKAWVRALESGLYTAYEHAARWVKSKLPDEFGVDVYSDFELSVRAATDLQTLLSMRVAGELDRETFLHEVKRRGILSDATDVAAIAETLEAEGRNLNTIGLEDE